MNSLLWGLRVCCESGGGTGWSRRLRRGSFDIFEWTGRLSVNCQGWR